MFCGCVEGVVVRCDVVVLEEVAALLAGAGCVFVVAPLTAVSAVFVLVFVCGRLLYELHP
jgi:hypothetical protein